MEMINNKTEDTRMQIKKERIYRLQEMMKASAVDLIAVSTGPNLKYFAGFIPHLDERFSVLFISPSHCVWVAPSLNVDEIAANTSIDLLPWDDDKGPRQAIRSAIQKIGKVRVLAVDSGSRSDALLEIQQVSSPELCITSDEIIAPLRQSKSEEEVAMLQAAAAQADRAMQVAIDTCKPGVTEKEVAWATEVFFRTNGAEMVDFTIIASGPNGAFPHHHSSPRKLMHGDAIVIDIGATLNGYKSDITRMVHLGEPDDEFMQVFDAVRRANLNARKVVKPGIGADEVDRAARETLKEQGLAQFFTHRTGHGIGLEGHEKPWIMPGNTAKLEIGMAFSIEPGAYLPQKFGVRIEDIVVVTEDGAKVLTQFPQELVIKS